ncbi:hypothetical protein [Stella sp.]|uniref:hypothetical protein n=1 Tax=Stella sp. TaxID=2912054 RepID=UPI0035AECA24
MATAAGALVAAEAAAVLGRPLLLVSPRGGAAALGPAMFAAIVERARERHPPTRGLIDCETAEGHALLALRVGIDAVVYKGPAAVRAKLAAIAAADGRRVVAERPPALALHREKDMAAACRRWLGDDPAAGPDARN